VALGAVLAAGERQMARSRITTAAMIPNTFTQRGVEGGLGSENR